jgi:hypothetical protein
MGAVHSAIVIEPGVSSLGENVMKRFAALGICRAPRHPLYSTREILTKKASQEVNGALVLAQLKLPLVVVGLALVVSESVFGAALLRAGLSERVWICFGCLMALLFVVTIGILGIVTLVVSRSLMILPQEEEGIRRLKRAAVMLSDFLSESGRTRSEAEELVRKINRLLEIRGGID